ncbi:hypothetical protein BH10CHL1_BH10CHL1_47750 [soil metagenome]
MSKQNALDDLDDLFQEKGPYNPSFSLEIVSMTKLRGDSSGVCSFTLLVGDALEIAGLRLMDGNAGLWLAVPKQRPVDSKGRWNEIIKLKPELLELLKDLAIEHWNALQMVSAFGNRTGRIAGKVEHFFRSIIIYI